MQPSPDRSTDKKPTPQWVTRAEAVAVFCLAMIFVAWVAVIVVQQHWAGRDIEVIRAEGEGYQYLVNLNSAGTAELTLLPGIGPVRAGRIVAWRGEHGPFRTLDDVRKAAGLSLRNIERIRQLVTLGVPDRSGSPDEAEPAPR